MDDTPCWIWPGSLRKYDGRPVWKKKYVYRIIYIALHGDLPRKTILDHICGVPSCVNPFHLQPLTQSEHIKLEMSRGKLKKGDLNVGQAEKKNCPSGHPYFGDNLYVSPNGDRHCRACRRSAKIRYRRKKREE